MNITTIFLLFILLTAFSNCTLDYLDFSGATQEEFSSAPTSAMVYCNKFNVNGFNGILNAWYDWDQEAFDTNKAELYLWNVPTEFTYPHTNYIQVHSFRIENNRKIFKESPISIEIIKNNSNERGTTITTLGHDLLEDLEKSIEELIQDNSFVLKDMKGWHGVSISVFNVHNKPITKIEILIPPFEAHPYIYLEKQNQERLLHELHPFKKMSSSTHKEKIFYEKGRDFCKDSPSQFEVPPFSTNSTEDEVDRLLKDLSFIY
ncbi:MAG: hypothetical protein OXM55_06465 [Bdellovibrionales bacterium]|nr:hypothetical protein [Bdellovibrionales bacterium]